ncbi:E3 ubiquitin-protein ligase TRIM39-like [Apteryx mantelli]|uniref:E3 ubiquitin-protein ligase TRIM39-like n=1 Tax=Apteryx mantelli TaxID=2696672 RepID=A0ABM4FY61_9AVES
MSMPRSGTPPPRLCPLASRKAKLLRSSLGDRLARAMAARSPAENLHSEASCSICLGFFQDPVSIHCGHNFCRSCITCCWEGLETNFSCPQCRQTAQQKSFRPSRELANIAEIARQLSPRATGGATGWETLCTKHREALKLFCKEDQRAICVVCDRSQAHRSHAVVPIEEAAQEYKEEIQARLQVLKEEREKFLESRKSRERKSSYLEKTKDEGKKIVCEFEHLHQFLKDQERLLLTQLADLDRAILKVQEEATAKITEEMCHLDTLIWEMEGKFQQPASKFLQDIRSLLSSCEKMKFNPPVEISPKLERQLEEFVQKNVLVRYTLRKCQDSLMFKLQEPTNVTLDPATAHPNLYLSEDQKEARGRLVQQDLPDNPERFDFEPCVLGCEGFTSGRHFWEVEVGQGGVWALGVARESVKRKGQISLTPKEGVWALEAYHSLTSPRANLRLNPLPRRIRVSLDYEAGRVAFFSTDDESPILVYTRASFNGQRVVPWFKMGIGARLQEVTQHPPSEDQSMAGQLMSPLDWVGFRSPLRICP